MSEIPPVVLRQNHGGGAMSADDRHWRDAAFEVYRLTWAEIRVAQGESSDDDVVDYYIEEMKESLLDLKQAVLEDDPARALRSADELTVLLIELRSYREGDEP
jgi:hypothetical protein